MSSDKVNANSGVQTPTTEAWRRLRSNRAAMTGLVLVLALIAVAAVGPWVSHYDYYEQNFAHADESPSAAHWFGTDELGRDQLTRVLYGARISLAVGIVASLIALLIGVTYGGVSGYFGGNVDSVMMRIIDLLYGIPLLLFVILLMVLLGTGLQNIFIALGAVYWLAMARIVRAQILSLKTRDYVQAARALGAGHTRLILLHLLPNTMGPIIVTLTLSIPEAIFAEAFLSFIGLGVSAPKASWGMLASDALSGLQDYPLRLFFPAAAICLTMLAFNFLGDGLRDALDPKSEQAV